MRLLFVVHRYGRDVAGGAELFCRAFATRLAGRHHEVTVLTSCAESYRSWENVFPPGSHTDDGVRVVRLPVASPRDDRFFEPLNARVVWGPRLAPLHLQRAWMDAQGPIIPELVEWLEQHAGTFDVVAFFTYLYRTTWAGLPAAAGLAPTVLHPTAHDEPALGLRLFEATFRLPSAFAFSTEEESRLVRRRFRITRPASVIGIGVDLDVRAPEDLFRSAYGLGDRPYLLYVGRVDPSKGTDELYDCFCAMKRLRPGPLTLVMAGDPVRPPPPHDDVVPTGVLDDTMRRSAVAGAAAVVQPSYFESFSMVLTEAWAQRKPVLVQGRSDVLRGQVSRSGGGIPYTEFAEFEAAVELLLEDPALGRLLGEAGRSYVERRYAWPTVLDRYERLLGWASEGVVPSPVGGRLRR